MVKCPTVVGTEAEGEIEDEGDSSLGSKNLVGLVYSKYKEVDTAY